MNPTSAVSFVGKDHATVHGLAGDWSIFRRKDVVCEKNVGRKHGPVPFRAAVRHVLLSIVLFAGVVSPIRADERADAKSSLDTDPQGWTSVMPPTDLKGWNRVPVPPGGAMGREQWHVDADQGLLICDGDGGHDMLLTEKEYGDAIFHFECRYTKIEGGKGYNSGAYVRNSADGAIWHQAQFGDAKDGFLFGRTATADGRGKSFRVIDPAAGTRVKPAGEWNTIEITARGKTLTLWVNGKVTCQFDDCGAERGHVGLEGEGYRIEFRNLQVKEL